MSVRIFHPMVAPFVQQAARALHEAGQLDRLVTSIRHDPQSLGQSLLTAAGRLVGFDFGRQLARRRVTELPPELVESHPWGELLRLLVSRIDRDGRLLDFTWERAEHAFDHRVARGLHAGLSGIYAFEYSSLATINRARALGLRVAYDVPAPEPRFVQEILDHEMANFPELVTPWHLWTAAREEERIARRRAEFQRAHLVIAASEFTRRSYVASGLDGRKIRVVPYGAPPPCSRDDALAADSGVAAPLTLLWAGTFSIRKGAHYLIDAWRAGNFGRHARLLVFGNVEIPERVLLPLPDGVELRGSIPRSELMECYRSSDALIFPTLCDGFGMVATEAWSRGLPVITTARAGAADLLQPRRNGLLIPAGNASALGECIDWCLTHRAELRAMREESLATAAAWQWSDYRRTLAEILRQEDFFSSP